MRINTDELEGVALNWFVAEIAGCEPTCSHELFRCGFMPFGLRNPPKNSPANGLGYLPSSDWSTGGPLIDSYSVALSGGCDSAGERLIYATCHDVAEDAHYATAVGPTNLIAAMRAIVKAKLGDVVEIPNELNY